MITSYKKTAKDLAWDRERAKLTSTIYNQKQAIAERDNEIDHLKADIQHLKSQIDESMVIIHTLRKVSTMTAEDIELLLSSERRNSEVHAMLISLFGNSFGEYRGSAHD